MSQSAVRVGACVVWAIVGLAVAPLGVGAAGQEPNSNDPVATLVSRLDLGRYKATVKGLTQFGDRRQGTDRNRAAVDWIEAQLKSYGCPNIARIKYDYQPPVAAARGWRRAAGGRAARACRPVSTPTR